MNERHNKRTNGRPTKLVYRGAWFFLLITPAQAPKHLRLNQYLNRRTFLLSSSCNHKLQRPDHRCRATTNDHKNTKKRNKRAPSSNWPLPRNLGGPRRTVTDLTDDADQAERPRGHLLSAAPACSRGSPLCPYFRSRTRFLIDRQRNRARICLHKGPRSSRGTGWKCFFPIGRAFRPIPRALEPTRAGCKLRKARPTHDSRLGLGGAASGPAL